LLCALGGGEQVTLVCLGVVRAFFDGDDEEREVALEGGSEGLDIRAVGWDIGDTGGG